MTRWKILIEYDGGKFVGWQRQANGPSVQQALEEAVEGFSGEQVLVQGAGRTDSGVHALGQVAHLDLEKPMEARKIREAINYHLKPHAIAVLEAEEVSEDFHARFSATGRAYLYRILDRRPPPTLDRGKVWHVNKRLDAEAMHDAAQVLIGNHDFTSFRAKECQAESPVKTLDRLDIERVGDEIHVHVAARSFLHHQVRNFVGTLRQVGDGRWTKEDVKQALEARHRSAAGPTAPACGLYLTTVTYPDAG